MQFSLVDGSRTLPRPGLIGCCPVCGRPTNAKCGPRVIWHWAHAALRHCDPWWENETPWHVRWKSFFAEEQREVVHTDPVTGERHVADVKTARGLVIELQNSPMPLDELRSREAFYGRMIWIVNAAPFLAQFHLLDPLPHPNADICKDVVFTARRKTDRGRLFWRRSENPEPDPKLVLIHSIDDIAAEIKAEYRGHHLFHWERPRAVWFDATAPVFLDPGGPELLRLVRFDTRGLWAVRRIRADALIRKNGGAPEAPPGAG